MSTKAPNFDDLKRLRDDALMHGRGSKAYFVFCEAVFDGFPALYQLAKQMNADVRLTAAQPIILAEIERITKGVIDSNEDVVDVLWVTEHQTFLDAMSDLHELVSGGQVDLQLKLWGEN